MIFGPVACGKSTLCNAILGEIPYSEGQVRLSTMKIAYCDQTPFLINTPIRQNILGVSPFDELWFHKILHAVTLDEDIFTFPLGDQTIVGTQGLMLSGGQKQRVAIAQALYSRKRLAIFDDVFSGLDALTKKTGFDRTFGVNGLLRQNGATVLLCTHDLDLLSSADYIIRLGSDGRVAHTGTFEELIKSENFVARDLSPRAENSGGPTLSENVYLPSTKENIQLPNTVQDFSRQTGDLAVYFYYFASIGTWNMIIYFSLACSLAFFYNFPLVWRGWRSEQSPNSKNTLYLGVYTVFQLLCLASISLLAKHTYTFIATKSGERLHWTLLKTALLAPMSFFRTTDVGSITNRFSQDILLIDTELPNSLMNLATTSLRLS